MAGTDPAATVPGVHRRSGREPDLAARSGRHFESPLFMPRFKIVPFDVDAAGPDAWAAFHDHRRAIAAELDPDDPVLGDEECEDEMRRTDPLWESRRWLALDGPDVVGFADSWFRRPGTPNAEEHARFLKCHGHVATTVRRKGIGTRLMQPVHALMHALDKTVLTMCADTDAGHAFLEHIGAAAKLSMMECRTLLDGLDWPRLRAGEDVASGLGLTWECYAGRVPRETLAGLLPAFTALIADIPVGSLDAPPLRLEIEAYDQWYGVMDRMAGAHHLVVLRDPEGAVIAMSEAAWDSRRPQIANQIFTAIARPWRRRGLARAVKAALMRQIRSANPGVREVRTFNADSNAPILAVNRRLGFTMLRRHVDYQITRAELDAKLRARGAHGP
jgi:GNAT superfamily N-acetyltransferase